VQAQQLTELLRQLPVSLATSPAALAAVAFVYYTTTPLAILAIWMGCVAGINLIRFFQWLRFRAGTGGSTKSRLVWFSLFAAIDSAIWGSAGVLFFSPEDPARMLFLVALMLGVTSASQALLISRIQLALLNPMLVIVPMSARFIAVGDSIFIPLGFLGFIYVALLSAVAIRFNKTLLDNWALNISLKRTKTELEAAKETAESANMAKSEFLANMSHELRTPLNAIAGFADIMRLQTFGAVGHPKYVEYVGDIRESADHLSRLINDILNLSRIEARIVDLEEEIVDVQHAVGDCITMIAEKARTERVSCVVDLAQDELPGLWADRLRLKQIVTNLLSNAVKFTPAGGTLTVTARADEAHGYYVQVADTGIGIAPDDLPKALSRFGQVDGALNRRYEGTGLGLPLAKSLVELHGGRLEIESVVNVGTTVTVCFPRERIVSNAAPQAEVA
jgi:signal transduction histidine kinase